MIALQLTTVGDDVALVLPPEARERLGVRPGDTVYLTEAPGGGWRITAADPDFARQMDAFERIMRADRGVFAALADR